MRRMYYYLTAGLREYTFGGDHKGFDAVAIKAEILEELSRRDAVTVKLLYSSYDIDNVIALRQGGVRFNVLGNIIAEELEEQLKNPARFPRGVAKVINDYYRFDEEKDVNEEDDEQEREKDVNEEDDEQEREKVQMQEKESADVSIPFEKAVYEAYYNDLNRDGCDFLSKWSDFDRTLRNICAAIIARRSNTPVAEVVIGEGEIADALKCNPASDFELRGEAEWIDRLLSIMEVQNLLEREQKIDLLRWDMVEEFALYDYFNVDRVMSYLIKVNIVDRWIRLDPEVGSAMFRKLIDELRIPEGR